MHDYKDAFRIDNGDLDETVHMCTHINYAFAKLDEFNLTMVAFDPYLEFPDGKSQSSWHIPIGN